MGNMHVKKWQIEVLGYLGMLIILISFALPEAKSFRMVNLVGAVITVLYATFIKSVPVIGLNLGIAILDIYYLLFVL